MGRVKDPAADYAHAANGPVLERLRQGAVPAAQGPFSPGGWTLRTHPDLEEALFGLAGGDAGHAYGVPVLAAPNRAIYAAGLGTGGIAFRAVGGPPCPDLGPGWTLVDAWRTDTLTLRTRARSARDAAAAIEA